MRSNLLRAPVAWIVAAGVLALSVTGCGDDESAPPEIVSHSAKIASDNALIAQVAVSLDREGPVYVEYENAEAGKFRTATTEEAAIEHRVPVLRLRPGTTYSYTVVATNEEGEETRSDAGTFTTGTTAPWPFRLSISTQPECRRRSFSCSTTERLRAATSSCSTATGRSFGTTRVRIPSKTFLTPPGPSFRSLTTISSTSSTIPSTSAASGRSPRRARSSTTSRQAR